MFRQFKRVVTAAAVVMAASAPPVAYARYDVELPGPSGSTGQAQSPIVSSASRTSASSGQSFGWDDAGVGAAGVLVLVGVGSGVVVARRRRMHHPLTG
jgi:hypothetical protein